MKTPYFILESRSLAQPSVRFALVSVAAFAVDLALALTLRDAFDLAVSAAAAMSFVLMAFVTYLIHEHWTFRREGSRSSARRLARNVAANIAALTVRVALIAAMEALHEPGAALAAAYIVIGGGASLSVNFLLNRFWVFAR
jgi:putative flippase GtrA